MGKHIKKWDKCFDKLKDEKGESGAAAICSSSIDNAGLKAENQKRDKKDYYSNKKKAKKINENSIISELQKAIEDYYHNAESLDIIVNLTGLDEDIVLDVLENSYHRNALDNLLSYSRTNESEDSFQGGGAYSGPNITGGLSGHMVGSGSDGRLSTNQTEIEGGDDSVTATGAYPMKYKRTVQHIKSRESKKRLSALKKMQKVNMMSFSDFNKNQDEDTGEDTK